MCRTACAATNTRVTPQTTYYNKLSAASLLVLTSPIIRAEDEVVGNVIPSRRAVDCMTEVSCLSALLGVGSPLG